MSVYYHSASELEFCLRIYYWAAEVPKGLLWKEEQRETHKQLINTISASLLDCRYTLQS